ncbi:MAG TPA: hypothetical protein VJC08_02355 [bacterium]|nr:hypothetical protein [bacterium]
MKSENKPAITLIAFLFFGIQYTFYKIAQVQLVPADSPLLGVIAYHLKFLMVMTFSAGIWVPLSLWLEQRSGKPNTAWLYGAFLFFLTVTGFVLFSYTRASRSEKPTGFVPGSVVQKAENQISTYVQFVDSEERLEKEDSVLRILLNFRNTSEKDITQIDYIFVALENGRISYRLNIRDTFLIARGKTAAGFLVWDRAKFKNPALFERMLAAFKAKTLRVYAKPTEIVFMDGSSLHE